MSLSEIRLLLFLNQPHHCSTQRELADVTGMSVRSLSASLQKLSHKGYLKAKNDRSTRQLTLSFLPASEPILAELAAAQSNYEKAQFEGFTDDDLTQYVRLSEKIKQNIQKIL